MSANLLYYDYEKFNLPAGVAYGGKLCGDEYCPAIHSAFLLAEKDFNIFLIQILACDMRFFSLKH